MEESLRTTLEQGRAAGAYKYVEIGRLLGGGPKPNNKGDLEESKTAKEYKSYLKKLPMLIKTNGLGAAMSFAFAKGKNDTSKAWGLIYHQVTTWLQQDDKHLIEISDDNLMRALTNADSSTYRATTIEVLALLNWMRRFAEGLISGEAENND